MFFGLYYNNKWQSNKQGSSRPCLYRRIGNGLVQVLPCSTNRQSKGTFLRLPLRYDVGLKRATNLVLSYIHRVILPESSIKFVSNCPFDIKEMVLDWEEEHTVCNP